MRGVERWCLSAAPHLSGRASLPFSSRTKNCQAGETTRPWKYWKPLWQLWQPVSTESGAPSYTKLHGCTQSNFIQVLHSSKRKRRKDQGSTGLPSHSMGQWRTENPKRKFFAARPGAFESWWRPAGPCLMHKMRQIPGEIW